MLSERIYVLCCHQSNWIITGEATDGVYAVEKAKQLQPNLLLMDIPMPHMDGLGATRIILSELPECAVPLKFGATRALIRPKCRD